MEDCKHPLSLPPLSSKEHANLKLVHLLLAISKLLQDARELALVLGADLLPADRLVHGWRPTHENLDILCLGFGEHGLEQVLGDETGALRPVLGRFVEGVKGTEAPRVGVFEMFELLPQQDVFLRDVGEDERHLGLVFGVAEDLADELIHGRDPGAACDQADVIVLARLPWILGKRAFEVKPLAYCHVVQVVGHRAVGVSLYQEIQVPRLACHVGLAHPLLFTLSHQGSQDSWDYLSHPHTFIADRSVRTNCRLLVR